MNKIPNYEKRIDIFTKVKIKFETFIDISFIIKNFSNNHKDAVVQLKWSNNCFLFDTEIKPIVNESIAGIFKQNVSLHKNTPILVILMFRLH